MQAESNPFWEVPYLPGRSGRTSGATTRRSSGSTASPARAVIAYLLETDAGYRMPRRMQIEFSQHRPGQRRSDGTRDHERAGPNALRARVFRPRGGAPPRRRSPTSWPIAEGEGGGQRTRCHAFASPGAASAVSLPGRGHRSDRRLRRARSRSSSSSQAAPGRRLPGARARRERPGGHDGRRLHRADSLGPGRHLYGAGVAPSIVDASFLAVLSAVGRAVERGWIEPPTAGGIRAAREEEKAPRAVRRPGGPRNGRG
jgi:hypothetical protein